MDLSYPPGLEPFRAEVRAWLEANLPEGWFEPGFALDEAEREEFNRTWPERLSAGRWMCATWPTEYGGRGLSTMESVVMAEEFSRAGAPFRADFFGDTLVGPTILRWGTEEQNSNFIPRILRGEVRWCQGFSEPDAGSDLASLATRAELVDGEWVIDGQKVWTTQAREADYAFVLCRTDPAAPRHRGISYLLVPMDQPGVEVRPIRRIDGGAEFCEVFFAGARCPEGNVVGEVGDGWRVAMTTLGFERGTNATTSYRRFERELAEVVDLARRQGVDGDPLVRQDLARAWTGVQLMRLAGLRGLTAAVQGDRLGERQRAEISALGAVNKMFWPRHHQEVMELALRIGGMEGLVLTGGDRPETVPGYGRRTPDPGYPCSVLQSSFFFSRSETIWGGSAEIQRNMVGERVLGLPKEPRPSEATPANPEGERVPGPPKGPRPSEATPANPAGERVLGLPKEPRPSEATPANPAGERVLGLPKEPRPSEATPANPEGERVPGPPKGPRP